MVACGTMDKTLIRYLQFRPTFDMLEQPCFESSTNFAARAFDREASHL
jgi:hypothetical protein